MILGIRLLGGLLGLHRKVTTTTFYYKVIINLEIMTLDSCTISSYIYYNLKDKSQYYKLSISVLQQSVAVIQ